MKLTKIKESYSSIKSNYLELVDAPADHPICQFTEEDCDKESQNGEEFLNGLRNALKCRVDTF